MGRGLCGVAFAALTACGGTSVTYSDDTAAALFSPAASAPAANTDVIAPDASFADLLNGVRFANGAGAVRHNSQLDQAAQAYSDLMLATGHFDHTGPDGSTMVDRVKATGYRYSSVAENIARGPRSAQEAMIGWTNSPLHHASNINPKYTEFGLGTAQNARDSRWVLLLAAPR